MKFTHKLEHKFSMYLFYPYLWTICLYLNFFDPIGFHVEEEFGFTCQPASENSGGYAPRKPEMQGSTWTIRNFGATYLMPSLKKQINERIERAVLQASREGIRVVGLGNFNKAEWMNHGGSDIVEKLGDRLGNTYISHGDTLSAAVVYQYAMALRQKGYWSRGVFVTGSTSKIGRAVVLSLAAQHIRVVMFTQVKARFEEIAAEAGPNRQYLTCAHDLADGKACDLWLTGKMVPYGKELLNALPYGSTLLNFSVPDPLTHKLLSTRPDILHLDTGLLAYNPKVMSPRFTLLLPDGMIYACLAGSVVHSALGLEAHEVGPVIVADMDKYWNAALTLGFSIPAPTSFYNPITMPPPTKLTVTTV
jgi:predicted amino acid dehydrogenase